MGCPEESTRGQQRAAEGSKQGSLFGYVQPGGDFFPTYILEVAVRLHVPNTHTVCEGSECVHVNLSLCMFGCN